MTNEWPNQQTEPANWMDLSGLRDERPESSLIADVEKCIRMQRTVIRAMKRAVVLVVLAGLGLACPGRAGQLPPIQTVFLILMENHAWSDIEGSTNAPYINQALLPQASYCAQYYNPSNFIASLISYLWLETGTNWGLTNDSTNAYNYPAYFHLSTTNHLVSLLNRAGISWKTYQECARGDILPLENGGCYVVRHDPFVYFDDVTGTNDPTYPYGVAHVRPYYELEGDLTNNTVARYNFITPGVCSDMHNSCPPLTNNILQGDTWLASQIPEIMRSRAYSNNGAIFIAWDDGGVPWVPIGMIVLSPLARGPGYVSTVRYTHSSTLRTLQETFQVRPWLGDAANAEPLADLFMTVNTNSGFRITSLVPAGSGTFQLTANGAVPSQPVVLESSTNLQTWTAVNTNTPSGSSLAFSITNNPAADSWRRFYRLVQSRPN